MARRHPRTVLALGTAALLVVAAGSAGLADGLAALPAPPGPLDDDAIGTYVHDTGARIETAVVLVSRASSPAHAALEHVPEVLLVVELGLLVEHLRLLRDLGNHPLSGDDPESTTVRFDPGDPRR